MLLITVDGTYTVDVKLEDASYRKLRFALENLLTNFWQLKAIDILKTRKDTDVKDWIGIRRNR